jgi:hypothetical protein
MAVGAVVARILTQYSDKGSKAAAKDIGKLEKQFGDFANRAAKAFGVAALAAGAFAVKLGKDSIQAAIQAQAEQNRLSQILLNTNGATKEQIGILNAQAEALERVGVVSAGNVSVVQSQLATFDLQASTIQTLTPAILDYVTAEKGATASADEFRSMTNGLAQALNGNFGSLTRTGFVLDENTKKMISSGNEQERSQAILEVLNSTYKDFNKNLRDTPEGKIQALRNSFESIKTTIGNALLPALGQFVDKLQNEIIPLVQTWVETNGEKLAIAFQVAIQYGIAFGKLMFEVFSFVARNTKTFMKLGAVIVAAFFGAKVAAAVAGLVKGIQAIITVMKALRTVGLATAAATALATGGISAAAGAAAFAVALGGMYLATKKFESEVDKTANSMDKFKFKFKGVKEEAIQYNSALDKINANQDKINKNNKKLKGIDDPITREAVRKNLLKEKRLGISSPTISLLASAGHGNIAKPTTITGGNIIVNVAGSVVSEGDLVNGIKNGLATLRRRRGGGGGGGMPAFAVL